jgi:hypothetical protein
MKLVQSSCRPPSLIAPALALGWVVRRVRVLRNGKDAPRRLHSFVTIPQLRTGFWPSARFRRRGVGYA